MSRFLDSWLICGPFFSDRGWATLDEDYLFGEASVRPVEGSLSFGREWMALDTADGFLQFLNAPFQHTLFCTAYAHAYVHSKEEIGASLLVGSDDGIAVWLNGEEIWRHDVNRACTPGDDQIWVRLEAGWNSLLVKVRQGMAHWQFCAQLADERGGDIAGVRWQREADVERPPTGKTVGVRVRFDSETYTARGDGIFRDAQFEVGATGSEPIEDAVIQALDTDVVVDGPIAPGETRLVWAELPFDTVAALMRGEATVRGSGSEPDGFAIHLSEPSRLLRDLFAPMFVPQGEHASMSDPLSGFAVAEFGTGPRGTYLLPDPPGLREHLGRIIGKFPMAADVMKRVQADCRRLVDFALAGDAGSFGRALETAELPPREDS